MKSSLFIVLVLTATLGRAQQFTLKDADGKEYGPFDLREGTRIYIGKAEATISTVTPLRTPNEPIITRRYRVWTSVSERISAASSGEAAEMDLKKLFADNGVSWPDGSSIRYLPSIGRIVVENTRENLEVFESVLQELNVQPSQVEIGMEFVAFDMTNIAAIASKGITQSDLTALWSNGCGQLIAAPRVVTQSGVEATVKGVTEYIYPTEFGASNTNATSRAATNKTSVVEPGSFETREAGAILQVLPEVSAEGYLISLTMAPEIIEDPEWRDYGSTFTDSTGNERQARMEQPFFHVYSISTSVIAADGQRVLVSGGMPSRDGKRLVYAFVTARLIGLDGQAIRRPKNREDAMWCPDAHDVSP